MMSRNLVLLAVGMLASSGPLHPASAADRLPVGGPVAVVSTEGPDRSAKQPQVAVDAKGRIYVAYGRGNQIRCAISTDGGKSFENRAVGEAGVLSLGMRRGPRIAVSGGSVVVSAVAGAEGKGRDGDILAWRSTDEGATWSGPTRLNSVEGSGREGLHAMASGPDGTLFCAWLDLRNQRTEIFGARSTDGGLTWEPDALVYQSPDRTVCQCCHPSVAFGLDGTLLVMWRNQIQNARDLYLSRSDDGGRTFEAAQKLGRGTWQINACPMDGGAVAALSGGKADSIWMRAGSIFEAAPGEPERRLGKGVQGWIAPGPGGTYSVWLESRPGKLLASLPGLEDPITLADRANDPVVASAAGGTGPVVAVWEAPPEVGGILSLVLKPSAKSAARP
ncbi:sialidase family protein [Tundrisphaera lichenicola]|uniref:sialidase family protein n=1 Tax=Tundrisphaera lichenicola TaxID=2029860 RepID=UPI003EBE2A0E